MTSATWEIPFGSSTFSTFLARYAHKSIFVCSEAIRRSSLIVVDFGSFKLKTIRRVQLIKYNKIGLTVTTKQDVGEVSICERNRSKYHSVIRKIFFERQFVHLIPFIVIVYG